MISDQDINFRVLHVLDRSIPNLSGYSIRSKYIVEFQARSGFKPVVVTSPRFHTDNSHDRINGIPYHRSCFTPGSLDTIISKMPFFRETREMKKLYKKIMHIIEQEDFDVVHAHSPSLCGLPAMKAARKKGIPFVYEVRAFWEDAAVDRQRFSEGSLRYRISQKMEQRIFDKADAIVCICEGLRSEIARRTDRGNIFVVPNGVDTAIFTPRPKSTALLEKYDLQGKTVIGFIGSFFTFEGLSDLICSMAMVSAEDQNTTALVVVGGGVEDERVRRLAEDLGLMNRTVIFTGRVPHDQIQDYYSIMDILVYPRISKRITELVTPLKPLEAMAMEKAVVASDVGGLRELIDHEKTGILYKAGDRRDLAEKLMQLAHNKKERKILGKYARQVMLEKRSWDSLIKAYQGIYHRTNRITNNCVTGKIN